MISNLNNKVYKNITNSRKKKKTKKILERDYVMIRLRPERFPSRTVKKLHARSTGPYKVIKKVGSNAYVLELPSDLGISSTFNISDLVEYRAPAIIPSEPFEPDHSFESEPTPECPPPNLHVTTERIERVLDDQAISTRNKGYQHYLVRW